MRHDKPPLIGRARGRWPGILSALSVPTELLDKRKHRPCPFCGGKDRFRFTDHEGDGRFFCNQCGSMNGIDFLMKINGWDFARTAKEIEAVLGEAQFMPVKPKANDPDARSAMQRLWDDGRRVEAGDFVDRYMASRGIGQAVYPACLRRIERTKHETEDGATSWHPAMLAKVIAPDGKPTNLHRTYLTPAGRKASVEPVRKTMWGTIAPGSAIRLFEPGPVMGIAEGIETAFAAFEIFRVPVWAAINSTILSGWQPPDCAQQIIIFGDNDPKFGGQAAALKLAHTLACRNLTVTVEIPPTAGADWNDVLVDRRRIAA